MWDITLRELNNELQKQSNILSDIEARLKNYREMLINKIADDKILSQAEKEMYLNKLNNLNENHLGNLASCDWCKKEFPHKDLTKTKWGIIENVLCPDCYVKATEREDVEVERGL